uniref:Bacterioferritin n=1 Tax=Candidatus Kentrum sp. LPFa TaxID=2126335 RepID=A0A450VYD2_9GAMM|nr:MAG: bacterioferritin [Candidatus Kentron sp. LPFa]VFK17115.1 MAG: bacterioferritin [Candidatus Kentron sp. LPFa]VFK31463.1 MAG: bacterioferritin [Candidatus Kentron sp. LPFa]
MYEKSIALLQKAVADELNAVHQYMYFHFHANNQGLKLLANLFQRTAIEEMIHIERIAERILFLSGDVEMEPSLPVEKIHDIKEMLAKAREMEETAIRDYNQFALDVGSDSATRNLFEGLVEDEERHFDEYGNESNNVERFGDSYLAQQAMENSRKIGIPEGNAAR